MQVNTHKVEQTLAALAKLNIPQLRAKYHEVFGEATNSGNRDFLFKRLAWRIQSQMEGTLSERARRRAEELARDADVRSTMPRTAGATSAPRPSEPQAHADDRVPIAGTVLTRKYRGKQINVTVLSKDFEYEGQTYRSLSAIAKAVTGSHWNGLLFFGLTSAKVKEASHV